MGAAVTVHDDLAALRPLAGAWDALADELGRPCSASAWMLAWARHVGGGDLRVAVVREAGEVVGILPSTVVRDAGGTRRLRLLGAGTTSGIEPLARPGHEARVAELAGAAIAARAPRIDAIALEGLPSASPWPGLIARRWPGSRPGLLHQEEEQPEPLVGLAEPGYDAWLAAKSANFRGQVRRAQRALEKGGGTVRRTERPEELGRDLAAFVRLHRLRWEPKGGSAVVSAEVERMLADAGPSLLAGGRLDLWSVDAGGETVGSQLWLRAGGVSTMWLSGSDDRYASVRPAMLIMAAVVREAYDSGLRYVSLGAGGQDYKRRFSDGEAAQCWWSLPLPGRRLPLLLGEIELRRARHALVSRLGDERKAQLRALADRASALRPGGRA